jgi:hypothetical protein
VLDNSVYTNYTNTILYYTHTELEPMLLYSATDAETTVTLDSLHSITQMRRKRNHAVQHRDR